MVRPLKDDQNDWHRLTLVAHVQRSFRSVPKKRFCEWLNRSIIVDSLQSHIVDVGDRKSHESLRRWDRTVSLSHVAFIDRFILHFHLQPTTLTYAPYSIVQAGQPRWWWSKNLHQRFNCVSEWWTSEGHSESWRLRLWPALYVVILSDSSSVLTHADQCHVILLTTQDCQRL